MKKLLKKSLFIALLVVMVVSACACGQGNEDNSGEQSGETPIINMAWDFDLHSAALLAAVSKGEEFQDSGYYLKEVVEKEQYELYEGDKKLALVNTIVTKGSSETAVMMGQG